VHQHERQHHHRQELKRRNKRWASPLLRHRYRLRYLFSHGRVMQQSSPTQPRL
jgi:hypothetical protein